MKIILEDRRLSLGRRVFRMFAWALILLVLAYFSFQAGERNMLNYINSWPEVRIYRT